ncbi:hypothetical protein, partial [Collinsella aerofaciens]
PTRGRPLCNRKKMTGRNVNPGLTEPKEKVALRHGAEVRVSSTGIFASILHMAIGMTVIAAVLAAIMTVFIH